MPLNNKKKVAPTKTQKVDVSSEIVETGAIEEQIASKEEIPEAVGQIEESCFIKLEALRGIQANTEYYTVQLRIDELKLLVSFAEKNIPAPQRIQRDLSISRVKSLAGYVMSNRVSYVLPAVTIVIEGSYRFEPYSETSQYGLLVLDEGTKLFPLDGQHRLLGLQHALHTMEDLGCETIAAIVLDRKGLLERRQAFFDINQLAKRVGAPAKAMDHRSPGTSLVAHVIAQDSSRYRVLVFSEKYINYNKASLGKKDTQIFSYTALQKAIEYSRYHIKNSHLPQQIETVREYWFTVAQYMTDWQLSDPVKVRDLTIATHGVTLEGLGKLGRCFLVEAKELGEGKIEFLKKLQFVDWSKGNEDWVTQGILDAKGKVITSGAGDRICSHLIHKLGLPIN